MLEAVMTVVSIVLTAASTYMVWVAQQGYKKKTSADKALMILMRHELREAHDIYMKRKSITPHELGEFLEIYEIYHELGGNGTGTVWKNDIEKLERKV